MRAGKEKAPFTHLLYREYVMAEKQLKMTGIILVLIYIICFMFTLSSVYGNIAKSDNDLCLVLRGALPSIKLVGIMMSFQLVTAAADISADLESKVWQMFRKSSPTSPFRMALAKYTFMAAVLVLAVIISSAYYSIDNMINPEFAYLSLGGVIYGMEALFVLITVTFITAAAFTGSTEKGGLLSVIIGMLLFAVFGYPKLQNMEENTDPFEMAKMASDFCIANRIWLIVFTVVCIIVGTLILTLIYKRRDK